MIPLCFSLRSAEMSFDIFWINMIFCSYKFEGPVQFLDCNGSSLMIYHLKLPLDSFTKYFGALSHSSNRVFIRRTKNNMTMYGSHECITFKCYFPVLPVIPNSTFYRDLQTEGPCALKPCLRLCKLPWNPATRTIDSKWQNTCQKDYLCPGQCASRGHHPTEYDTTDPI